LSVWTPDDIEGSADCTVDKGVYACRYLRLPVWTCENEVIEKEAGDRYNRRIAGNFDAANPLSFSTERSNRGGRIANASGKGISS